MAKQSLSERIQVAIKGGSSRSVQALIFEVERAAEDVVVEHDAARDRALDPLLSDADMAAARKAMEDADFTRERMAKAATVLREKLAEFEDDERQAERQKAYDAALAKRDAASARLKTEYPELANGLGALLADVFAADQAVIAANGNLPSGADRIAAVEAHCRPAPSLYSPWAYLTALRIPAWDQKRAAIWGRGTSITDSRPRYQPEITDAEQGPSKPEAASKAGEAVSGCPASSANDLQKEEAA